MRSYADLREGRGATPRLHVLAVLLVAIGSAAALHAQAADPQNLLQQGEAAMHANQPQQALTFFEQAIAADSNSAPANLLAASAAVQAFEPAQAIKYGERAKTLEPDNWKIDTTLVTAYAMAGDASHRDAERALLRKAHEDPKLTEARQTKGFLLDMFHAGSYNVEAVEYFNAIGTFNTYYRFLIRDPKTHQLVWAIEANSDSRNQASWAQAYPKQAADGQRQFQIEGVFNGMHRDYRTFSGTPNYDWIKSQVTKIVASQSGPFSGDGAPQ